MLCSINPKWGMGVFNAGNPAFIQNLMQCNFIPDIGYEE